MMMKVSHVAPFMALLCLSGRQVAASNTIRGQKPASFLADNNDTNESRGLMGCDDGTCHLTTADEWCECEGGEGAFALNGQDCYDDFEEDCDCLFPDYQMTSKRCEYCNRDNPDEWCRDEGGDGAYALDGANRCYDDFEEDCTCFFGYRKTDHECEDCHLDAPNAWCRTFSSVAASIAGRDCYDDFEDDCQCPISHRQTRDDCEQCYLDNPDAWCRRFSNRAYALDDQSCYDDFEDDCACEYGYRITDDGCEDCFLDDPDAWCRRFYSTATAIPGEDCYYDFEDHCQCPEGFIADDDTCEIDCHDDDPDEFCREQGGDGAFAPEGLDCWENFADHCECFEQFDKQADGCVSAGTRFHGNRIFHAGNDDYPESAFPMQRCQGDCDSDDDCAEGLTCYMRDGMEAVPGCEGGEEEPNDYDYCIGPPTESPTAGPSLPPATAVPAISPTVQTKPPVPSLTQAPTQAPVPMTMVMPVGRVPQPPPFIVPMPPSDGGDTMYDVRYVGRFQKVQEAGCEFPTPEVVIGCTGGIGMVTTSDPTIVCGDPVVGTDGASQVTCTNTCEGEACEAIFLGSTFDGDFGDLRLFGEVFFQCQGADISDVAGWISLTTEGDGSCSDIAMMNDGIGASFLTAQLGVYGMMVDDYIYDDSLFECNTNGLSVSLSGVYSCTFGQACFDGACIFTMQPLNVTSDIHRFPTQFIRANDRSELPEIPDPMSGVVISGERTAQFQVNSGFYYDETACAGTISGLTMRCLDGTISLVENQSGMGCVVQGTDTIECNEGTTAVARNQYLGVLRYECTSTDQVPQTIVENTGSNVECTSAEEQVVSLELQVGAVCMGGSVMYDDFFYECGPQSSLISREDEFTCGISGVVPANAGQVGFDVVSVETDFRWGTMGSDMCLSETETQSIGTLLSSSISSSAIFVDRVTPVVARSENPDLP